MFRRRLLLHKVLSGREVKLLFNFSSRELTFWAKGTNLARLVWAGHMAATREPAGPPVNRH